MKMRRTLDETRTENSTAQRAQTLFRHTTRETGFTFSAHSFGDAPHSRLATEPAARASNAASCQTIPLERHLACGGVSGVWIALELESRRRGRLTAGGHDKDP